MNIFNLFKKSRKIIYTNGTITVTLTDKEKTVLTFHNSTEIQYKLLNNDKLSDQDIKETYKDWVRKEKQELEEKNPSVSENIKNKEAKKKEVKVEKELLVQASNKFPLATNTGEFYEKEGSLYMNNVPLSIPKLLVTKFLVLIKLINENDEEALDEYLALKNFWLWTSLCPSAESRESLFRYIDHNSLKVNKFGFFCAYRKVVSVGKVDEKVEEDSMGEVNINLDKNLSEFISKAFLKIKGQKKSPKNFIIWEGNKEEGPEYVYYHIDKKGLDLKYIGNVSELYQSLSNNEIKTKDKTIKVQTYTDANTGKMDIRIGKEVSISAEKCDFNVNNECSAGLHLSGSKDYGCGDTPILVLVNPKNVVACPYADGHKMRVSAYLPIAVLNESERGKIADEIDTLELGTEYYEKSIKQLNDLIKNNTPQEIKQHKFLNELDTTTLKLIAKEAESIPQILSKRIIKVK